MKYVKRLLPLLIVALMLVAPVHAFAADNPVQLFLNGKKLNPEVPPQIVGEGTTIVPLRILFEELGADVFWFPDERKVTVERDGTTIEMFIDNPIVSVNGKKQKLEAAPVLQSGNTLVPIRFVAEQLGFEVDWEEKARAVILVSKPKDMPASGVPADSNGGQAPGGGEAPASGGNSAGGGSSAGGSSKPSDKPGSGSTGSDKPGSGSNGSDKPGSGTSGSGGGLGQPGTGNGSNPSGPNNVVTLTKLEASGDKIVFRTSGDAKPKDFTLKDPFRIVIDIPYAELGAFGRFAKPGEVSEIVVNHPKVSKIRYALFSDSPSTIRLVLDMKVNTDYSLTEDKANHQWTIDFNDKQYKVVIDAGHGGSDPGAASVSSRREKEFTLSVANKVYELLKQVASIRTYMTRTDDTYPTLEERVALANSVQADLFVSIHGNSYKPTISGTETYYEREESRAFAEVMHRHLIAATGLPDRRVRRENFKVVRDTTMPAVLLEVGYLSNAHDEALMFSEPFQDKVAAAIAAGIKEQLGIADATAKTKSAANGTAAATDASKTGQSGSKQTKDVAANGANASNGAVANDESAKNAASKESVSKEPVANDAAKQKAVE
jgi:N-acetylmuramoyl-L-alanine amidase